MIPLLPTFLARSSEDSMIKLIFGAIVLAFWVGGAIVSAINKRVQENKRRARYGQMPPTFMRPIPPPVPNPAGFSGKAKPPKKTAKRKPAAAPQPPARPALTAAAAQPAPATPPARPAAAAQVAPSAIARLIRRPETLRAALILNEVLSPPLSLRNGVQSGRRVE